MPGKGHGRYMMLSLRRLRIVNVLQKSVLLKVTCEKKELDHSKRESWKTSAIFTVPLFDSLWNANSIVSPHWPKAGRDLERNAVFPKEGIKSVFCFVDWIESHPHPKEVFHHNWKGSFKRNIWEEDDIRTLALARANTVFLTHTELN